VYIYIYQTIKPGCNDIQRLSNTETNGRKEIFRLKLEYEEGQRREMYMYRTM
jgi:hypothetical protein